MCPVPSRRNTYVLAGIVSAGISCGLKDVPEVNIDVAKNRDWLDSKLRAIGIWLD